MEHHEVLVIGGGNAGISLAARLLRDGARDVALVESESVHRYRPLLNYVGAGEATMDALERPAASVMPKECTFIQDEVVAVHASGPSVVMRSGRRLTATTLVICTGLEEDWDAVPGLAESYAAGWAGSTFIVDTAPQVWPALKPLFMACDHWRDAGVLPDIDVHLVLPGSHPIGFPQADHILEGTLASYGINVFREARVAHVGDHRITVRTPQGDHVVEDVTYAHVIPHYRAPAWISESGLAGGTDAGLVDVDPSTLQHRRHPSIWSLGDVADLGIKPSGGALRKQVVVLSHNIAATDPSTFQRYDGYTVMPITVARHSLMLVEIDRDGDPQPSVPVIDLVRPRRTMWWVDRYALPRTYFRRILRGKV